MIPLLLILFFVITFNMDFWRRLGVGILHSIECKYPCFMCEHREECRRIDERDELINICVRCEDYFNAEECVDCEINKQLKEL